MADGYEYHIMLDGEVRTFQNIEDVYDFFKKMRKRHGISHVYQTTLAREFRRLANYISTNSDNTFMSRNVALLMGHVQNAKNGFDAGCYAVEEYPTSDYCVWLCSEENALLRALQFVLARKDAGSHRYGLCMAEKKNIVTVTVNIHRSTVDALDILGFQNGLTREEVINMALRKYCQFHSGENYVHAS